MFLPLFSVRSSTHFSKSKIVWGASSIFGAENRILKMGVVLRSSAVCYVFEPELGFSKMNEKFYDPAAPKNEEKLPSTIPGSA